MRRLFLFGFLPAIFLALCGPAPAQASQKGDKILLLLTITHEMDTANKVIVATVDAALTTYKADHPQVPVAVLTETRGRILADSANYAQPFKQALFQAYDATFTEAEIARLLAFYQSPTGRMYLTKYPELQGRMSVFTAGWNKEVGGRIGLAVKDALHGRGYPD